MRCPTPRSNPVSILILLEQSQQHGGATPSNHRIYRFQSLFFWNNLNNDILCPAHGLGLSSFNPYSSGTISTTLPTAAPARRLPWFQSLFFWNNLNNTVSEWAEEHRRLGFQSLFFWNNLNNDLERYGFFEDGEVSILILLEQSQQPENVTSSPGSRYWFQSLFFWNNLNNNGRSRPPGGWAKRFNPYSSGTISTT